MGEMYHLDGRYDPLGEVRGAINSTEGYVEIIPKCYPVFLEDHFSSLFRQLMDVLP